MPCLLTVRRDLADLFYCEQKGYGANMRYLTVALAKGRLAEKALELFREIGSTFEAKEERGRKLIFVDEMNKIKFFLAKAGDVPVYVEYGAADIGIVGKDTLLEEGRDIYELLDLGFGKCRMCVAAMKDVDKKSIENRNLLRVGTKYPKITRDFFQHTRGQNIEVITLTGSVELAPLVGLSDVIVDIVESGKTLDENDMWVVEEICDLSARLVVNRVSVKMERERILDIVDKLRGLV